MADQGASANEVMLFKTSTNTENMEALNARAGRSQELLWFNTLLLQIRKLSLRRSKVTGSKSHIICSSQGGHNDFQLTEVGVLWVFCVFFCHFPRNPSYQTSINKFKKILKCPS